MKIIYTIAGLYRPAGMERILTDKANYLAGEGYDITIVTTEQKGRPAAFELDPRIRTVDLGIGYEDNNGGPFISKLLLHPFKQCAHRRKLRKLLMQERPDITVSMFCGDERFLPGIQDGSSKVLEVHFSRFKRLQYGRSGLWALADRMRSRSDYRTVRRFDRFVCLTNEDFGYWGRPENGRVIHNFIDSVPPEPSLLSAKTVLAVGRYMYQKGFERLVEAWRMLPEGHGWTLRIVGGGPMEDELRKQAAGLSVEIAGPSKDMAGEYAGASLLALSSRYEGLPMVLLEAQAWGLPVVSFDCKCGPRDVITDGEDGILVPEGDIKALAEALARVIGDSNLRSRMGAAAREHAARWDKEIIMDRWIDLFEEIS